MFLGRHLGDVRIDLFWITSSTRVAKVRKTSAWLPSAEAYGPAN